MKYSPFIFLILLVMLGCRQKPFSETEAQAEATRLFLSDCKAFRYDPSSFSGPVISGPNKLNGGVWYSYEWTHKSGKWGTLVTVKDNWEINTSGVGEIPK